MPREGFISAISPLSEGLTTSTIVAGLAVARGGHELWNMWQTSGNGNLTAKNIWLTNGRAVGQLLSTRL